MHTKNDATTVETTSRMGSRSRSRILNLVTAKSIYEHMGYVVTFHIGSQSAVDIPPIFVEEVALAFCRIYSLFLFFCVVVSLDNCGLVLQYSKDDAKFNFVLTRWGSKPLNTRQ